MRRPLIKLLVLLVAAVGLTGMILFKFKYDQMRTIVDGAGLEAVDRYLHYHNLVHSTTNAIASSRGPFESPAVSWNNISHYFLFSAFLCLSTNPQIKWPTQDFCGIGFGPGAVPNYLCSVWFDLGQEVISVPGTFTYSSTSLQGSTKLAYEFRCSLTNLRPFHRHPYVFALKTADYRSKILVPIYRKQKAPTANSNVLCIYPDSLGYTWKSMVEFFTYHSIIGFSDIIAYDNGINFGFLEKMKKLAHLSNGSIKSFSLLRWDFPMEDPVSNYLVERDCIHRTSGVANITAILNWNQIIIPSKGKTIDSILPALGEGQTLMTRLPSKRCCTDAMDDRRSEKKWPLLLKKTLCIPHEEPNLLLVQPISDPPTLSEIAPDVAELLTFSKCTSKRLSLSEILPVFSTWKYLSDILASDTLRLWQESDIFSITSK